MLPLIHSKFQFLKNSSTIAIFFEDKLFKGEKICAHNVIISDSCLKRMNEEYIPKFSSPLLTIECGMDKQVSNKAIRSFYEKCKSIDKTIINYDEVEHNI